MLKRFGLAVDVEDVPGSTHNSQNKSTFHLRNYTMQKRLPSVPSEQNVTCVFTFSHLSAVQLIYRSSESSPLRNGEDFSRLETTLNCSASYFWVCESSSSSNACNSTPSIFLVIFHVSCLEPGSHHFWNAETTVHTYFAMEHVHHKLLEVIDMIRQ